MIDSIDATQKALGAGNTQIVQQNNYYGCNKEEMKQELSLLFTKNFPELREIAMETARKRVDEFLSILFDRIEKGQIADFIPFADPDVQYIVWKAEREYARSGAKEKLDHLCELIAQRVRNNNNNYLKIVINKAIEIVSSLSVEHLDYLSALFICKRLKLGRVLTIEDLKYNLNKLHNILQIGGCSYISLLKSLGCIDTDICAVCEKLSEGYGFSISEICDICPKDFASLHPDYTTSHIGTVLAIINLHSKTTEYRFNVETWVNTQD